ncbi:MAG: glycosyltransferase family 2 protein [Candidatus Zixiibacteriota bacterium]|nr:MAG: glycosyltransferase family 2 protein [candidate division Zixibacteria bacterium]
MSSLISVIVPAYNEEGNISEFCRQFGELVEKSPLRFELVLIDDGSDDGTYGKIIKAAESYPFIKYARHPYNLGLTEALQTGFSLASGELYVFYPADLQYRPEDIPALVKPLFEGADVSTGWKQGKYKRRIVSGIYNFLSRKIFGLKVHDLNSVKAFKADVVKDMFLRRDWHRYLVVMAADKGHRIAEVRMPLYERKWGKSKFSIWRIPVGVLDMLAVKAQLSFLKKPLLFFGLIGSFFIVIGILVGLYAIYLRFIVGEGQRPLLYLVLLLSGLGMGFFILGFLAESLAALREEMGAVRKKIDKLIGSSGDRD